MSDNKVAKWSPSDSLADDKMEVVLEADEHNKSVHIPATPSPKRLRQSLTSDSPNFYDFSKFKNIVNKFKQTTNSSKPTMFSSPSVLISHPNDINNEFELKLQSMQNRPKKMKRDEEAVKNQKPAETIPEKPENMVNKTIDDINPIAPDQAADLDDVKLLYKIPKVVVYEPNDPYDRLNFKLIENIKNQNKNILLIMGDLKSST